jgi:hypothetical protein
LTSPGGFALLGHPAGTINLFKRPARAQEPDHADR